MICVLVTVTDYGIAKTAFFVTGNFHRYEMSFDIQIFFLGSSLQALQPKKTPSLKALFYGSEEQMPKNAESNRAGVFTCRDCGKVYKHQSNLCNHRRFECGKEPQFACPHCPSRFNRKHHLKMHLERRHSDQLP